jgi:hypothetical protein
MMQNLQFKDVAGKKQIRLFNYEDEDYMLGYARELFGDARSERLNVTATHFPSFRTEVFNCGEGEEGISIADAVTRTSSVPVIFPPAKGQDERGGLWVDGAAGRFPSAGYAHWAPRADTLVCISALSMHMKAPLPGPLQHAVGWGLEKKTRLELHRWKKRNPMGKVIFIRPNEEIGKMITAKTIFDFRAGEEVYHMARTQMADLIDGSDERNRKPRESIANWAIQLCSRTPEPEAAA